MPSCATRRTLHGAAALCLNDASCEGQGVTARHLRDRQPFPEVCAGARIAREPGLQHEGRLRLAGVSRVRSVLSALSSSTCSIARSTSWPMQMTRATYFSDAAARRTCIAAA